MMGDFTRQREYEGKEIFYKSKLSSTPKRKVASPPRGIGRNCEEEKNLKSYQKLVILIKI